MHYLCHKSQSEVKKIIPASYIGTTTAGRMLPRMGKGFLMERVTGKAREGHQEWRRASMSPCVTFRTNLARLSLVGELVRCGTPLTESFKNSQTAALLQRPGVLLIWTLQSSTPMRWHTSTKNFSIAPTTGRHKRLLSIPTPRGIPHTVEKLLSRPSPKPKPLLSSPTLNPVALQANGVAVRVRKCRLRVQGRNASP